MTLASKLLNAASYSTVAVTETSLPYHDLQSETAVIQELDRLHESLSQGGHQLATRQITEVHQPDHKFEEQRRYSSKAGGILVRAVWNGKTGQVKVNAAV